MPLTRTVWSLRPVLLLTMLAGSGFAGSAVRGADSAADYLLSCRKENGAFGPSDQEYTDAAWNYPAVHALRLLGVELDRPQLVRKQGLGYPAGHAGYGHWLVFHQAMLERFLSEPGGADSAAHAKPPVKLEHQGFDVRYYGSPFGTEGELHYNINGPQTAERFAAAKSLGYYNLSSLYYTLAALGAAERNVAESAELVKFIHERQAPGGGFVDLRTADGEPVDAQTHLATTYHAVAALTLLGAEVPRRQQVLRYVRSCQVSSDDKTSAKISFDQTGGFRWSPDAALAGNVADVYYTWCGLQTLQLLNASLEQNDACAKWASSLQNHDGGFGDRPGWRSRLYSSYYAIHSLALLAAMQQGKTAERSPEAPLDQLMGLSLAGLPQSLMAKQRRPRSVQKPIPADKFHIYQGLFKTPVVEPKDLAGLEKRGLNLLAMKTADFSTATPLLAKIKADPLPMDVVLCLEAYPHRALGRGGLLLNHVGNFTLNPRWSAQQMAVWNKADAAGKLSLPWAEYCQQVLGPLQQQGSLCYPEQDFEMEHAYAAYDAGLFQQQGYNAVQAGFNWTPRDFVRVFPWRERYADKLPMIADADAHGDLAKWSPQLDHVRHLYLAEQPGYSDFLAAAKQGRVVAVIAQPAGVASGVTYYGPPAAVEYVKRRRQQWQWW